MERMVILNENYYSRGHYIPENVGYTRDALEFSKSVIL